MTEAEWLANHSYGMLEFLREKVSDRKLRLFAVACCRRPYYSLADTKYQRAVLLAERMADEVVDEGVWETVHKDAQELWRVTAEALHAAFRSRPKGDKEVERLLDEDMATAAGWVLLEDGWEAAHQVTSVDWSGAHSDEPRHQSALLRDIFGNPFRPVAIHPRWLTETAVALASSIYAERAFDRMPILADALEDAGCDHADILSHCRGDSPHVRGCWVVDLVLGKE